MAPPDSPTRNLPSTTSTTRSAPSRWAVSWVTTTVAVPRSADSRVSPG